MSNETQPLVLRPIFSDAEKEKIQEKWRMEILTKEERKRELSIQEERLVTQGTSARASEIIDHYEHILNLRNQSVSAEIIQSPDDVSILLRYAAPKMFGYDQDLDSDEVKRKKITSVNREDIKRARLLFPINLHFPYYHYAIIAAFPKLDIQMYQIRRSPSGYWRNSTDLARESIKYYIEDEVGIKKEDPDEFRDFLTSQSYQVFLKHDLFNRVLHSGYSRVPFAIIDNYPELKLKPWEFKTQYEGDEGEELKQQAVRWIIEERLGLTPSQAEFRDQIKMIRAQHFIDARMSGILRQASLNDLIYSAYPDLSLEMTEFSRFPTYYWQGDEGKARAIEHTRQLIEDKLGIQRDQPDFVERLSKVSRDKFAENGLSGMLRTVFNHSAALAISSIYPDLEFKEWELGSVPDGFWQENNFENVKIAVRWLAEEKLGFSGESPDFREKLLGIRQGNFVENRLNGMRRVTGLTIPRLLQITYPELDITSEEYKSFQKQKQKKQKPPQRIRSEKAQELINDAQSELDKLLRGEIDSLSTYRELTERHGYSSLRGAVSLLFRAGILQRRKEALEVLKPDLVPSSDLAYVMALLSVGGSVDLQNGQITYVSRNEELKDRFIAMSERLFKRNVGLSRVDRRTGDKRIPSLNSVEIARQLGDLRKNFWPDTIAEKHNWVTQDSKFSWAFLSGVFDDKAIFVKGNIILPISYLKQANFIVQLLVKNGVQHPTITKSAYTPEKIQGVAISNLEDLKVFATNVYSSVTEKERILQMYRDNSANRKSRAQAPEDERDLINEWKRLCEQIGHIPNVNDFAELCKKGETRWSAAVYARVFGSTDKSNTGRSYKEATKKLIVLCFGNEQSAPPRYRRPDSPYKLVRSTDSLKDQYKALREKTLQEKGRIPNTSDFDRERKTGLISYSRVTFANYFGEGKLSLAIKRLEAEIGN